MSQSNHGGGELQPTRRLVLALASGALAACATGGSGPGRAGAPSQASSSTPATAARGLGTRTALRVPARARLDVSGRISPLYYGGGFDAKTAMYETLVRMGPNGRLVPGLARAWSAEDGGRTHSFELRPGAQFHDGTPADAESVRLHMRRWVGLPEHAWLESSDHIVAIEAPSERVLRVRLDQACDLLPDLLSINPCAITAPSSLDRKGEFARALGSGPFRFVEVQDEGHVVRCARFAPGASPAASDALVDFVTYTSDDKRRPIDDLFAGRLDAVVDAWSESMPRERVLDARKDARFRVSVGPGGSVTLLGFRRDEGPTRDASVRRRIRAALDRASLVQEVELGFAQPCATWAAPTIVDWPAAQPMADEALHSGSLPKLRLLRQKEAEPDAGPDMRLHQAIERQLREDGIAVELVSLPAQEFAEQLNRRAYDLLVMRTLGVPYDPGISLTRFLPPPARPCADSRHRIVGDPQMSALVREVKACSNAVDRRALNARVQARIDREATVIPLYVPQRVAVVRKEIVDPVLDHDIYRVDLLSMLGERPAAG